jgi:hypothetical protein
MTIKCVVYLLRFDGRPYIGSTQHFKARVYDWRSKLSRLGIAFTMRPLLVCGEQMRYFFEARAIEAYDSVRRGWNCTTSGKSGLGQRVSQETRNLLSDMRKGRAKSSEHRAKIGEANRGRPVSAKTRAALDRTGRPHTEEARAKMRAARRRYLSGKS